MRNRYDPRRPQEEGPPGWGPPQRAMVTLRALGAPSWRASATVMRSDRGRFDPDRPADLPGGLQPDLDGLARDTATVVRPRPRYFSPSLRAVAFDAHSPAAAVPSAPQVA